MIIDDWNSIDSRQLMLWIMHRFTDVFREHAVLKGGVELMLLNSQRATNDLDYIFVPFNSKKDVTEKIDIVLSEIPGAETNLSFHSKSGRYLIHKGAVHIQIEFDVALSVKSTALSTQLLAKQFNTLPKAIRVMSFDVAFAHKLAAWNERRLIRDLYDCYYFFAVLGEFPDREIFLSRLNNISSRIPRLKAVKKMTVQTFCNELRTVLDSITEDEFLEELIPLFSLTELEGVFPIFKSKLKVLNEKAEEALG